MQALERAQVRGIKDPPDAPRVDNIWDEVPPRPSELQDLIKNLFAHDDIINESQQLPDVPAGPNLPYKQTLRKIKLERAYSMNIKSSQTFWLLTLVTETYKGILGEIRDSGEKQDPDWTDAVSILHVHLDNILT